MLELTQGLLSAATGLPVPDASPWVAPLQEAADRFAITTPERLAIFLAHAGHESIGFKHLEENLYYTTAERIVEVFRKRYDLDHNGVISQEELAFASTFLRQPERLANHIYAGRYGNGPEASGDGWSFRGRGIFQLTFRENYRAASLALGMAHDLEEHPDAVALPKYAALTAGWYWDSRHLNVLADRGDFQGTVRRINGGMNGYADRCALWARARRALGLPNLEVGP